MGELITRKLVVIVLISLLVATSIAAIHQDKQVNTSKTAVPLADYGTAVPVVSCIPFYSEYGVTQYEKSTFPVPAKINILMGFQMSNTSKMNSLLAEISSPASANYHHYLTKSQFDSEFGGSVQVYNDMIGYLKSRGVTDITAYSDRVSLAFSGTPTQVDSIFNVSISEFNSSRGEFYATTSIPELPQEIARNVTAIQGLTDYSKYTITYAPLTLNRISIPSRNLSSQIGPFPQPINYTGTQYLFGSDMQVAYQDLQLFKQYGYPTDMVEATILWSGSYQGITAVNTRYGLLQPGTPVGPFYPSDVYAYLNQTLPKGEPHSTVYGVPIGGAPQPGFLASYDTTNANVENTLDLEMLASLAPGSRIYNFYGATPNTTAIDQAFSTILNPGSDPSLGTVEVNSILNVSVISNSWGANDSTDPVWSSDLQQAQLRGITVLASSGDTGDYPQSSYGIDTLASFPASAAYDTYGTVAVGGTTTTLTKNLTIASQTNWYYYNSTYPPYTIGTQSGISNNYSEPSWQVNSLANQLINGLGRGIPDISALADKMVLTITISGSTYNSSDLPYGVTLAAVMGTSISSPMLGGLIAELNHALRVMNKGYLGFLDPALYQLGNQEYTQPTGNSTIAVQIGTGFNSSLPVLPFYPVTTGNNYVYSARYGYSLLNGWGTLNAYDFMSAILNATYPGKSGYLSGAYYNLSLTSINASLQNQTGADVNGDNFTITLSSVIADSTGQPTYLVSESVSFSRTGTGTFTENFSAYLEYPFLAQTASKIIETGTFANSVFQLPGYLNLSVMLDTSSTPLQRSVLLEAGSNSITLSAPLGAYLIGILNYSYYYGDSVYYNGPVPDNQALGGLDPQLTIGSGNQTFTSVAYGTISGTITAGIRTAGSTLWKTPGTTLVYGYNILKPTGARNFGYIQLTSNSWNIGFSLDSNDLGIASFENGNYMVSFKEAGLPLTTGWYVNVSGLVPSYLLGNESYNVILTNGTYSYSASSTNKSYSPVDTGTFSVNGQNISVTIHFTLLQFNVTFVETGLGQNVTWSLSLAGYNSTGPLNQSTYTYALPNGTYHYSVSRSSNVYTISNFNGEFQVSGTPLSISLGFYKVTYTVVIRETGLAVGQTWNITFGGVRYTLTGSSMILVLSNGSYQYSVESIPGYHLSNPSGVLVVNGSLQDLAVKFSKSGISVPGYVIDLGIGSAIVAAIAYVVYRIRYRST